MLVRSYRPSDAGALADIFHRAVHELGGLRYSPAQVHAWSPEQASDGAVNLRAQDGRATLVAEEDGLVVAFGELEQDGCIDMLYRRPGAEHAGVGERLLAALVEEARRRALTSLWAEASELARGAFERNGFHVVRRQAFELRGVAIHNYRMERALG